MIEVNGWFEHAQHNNKNLEFSLLVAQIGEF